MSGVYPPATETWLVGDTIESPIGGVARWVCITAGTPGTWRAEYVGAPATTSAELSAVGDAVNTADKYAGKEFFNTTVNKPVYASGSTAAAVWVYADGTTAFAPA